MKRLAAAALLWGLLTAAAPLPVRLTPERPVLGVPLLVTVELPEAATELAGLPALAPFELLEPPQRQGRELRLLLLPMRPGSQQIPPLPLLQGASRQLSTAALTVTVDEGIPAGAAPAPLKTIAAGKAPPLLWAALLLPAMLAAALLFSHRRRPAAPAQPPLESLRGEDLLAALRRRLATDAGLDTEGRRQLAEEIDRLRFAPVPPEVAEIRQLLAGYLALRREAP